MAPARGAATRRGSSAAVGTSLLALLALLALATTAHAHGTLLQPRSRNFLAYLRGEEYYAHGLSAGGAGVMSDRGALRWPAMRLESICGGAPGNSHWDVPGEVVATYAPGSIINVDAVITVNHLGRARVRLCPLDAKRMDGRDGCVDLERADGKGTVWSLPFVGGWTGGTAGFVPPLYGDGFYEAYTLPSITPKEGCGGGQTNCDAYKGMVVYRTKWRLPSSKAAVREQRYKIVWEWQTAHSCWPPCPSELENEPTCKNAQVFPTCGDARASFSEYFFNCATVLISSSSSSSNNNNTSGGEPLWRTDLSRKPAQQWGAPVIVRMNDASGKPLPYKPASGQPPFSPGPKSPWATGLPPAYDPQQYTGPAPPLPADAPLCYKTSFLQARPAAAAAVVVPPPPPSPRAVVAAAVETGAGEEQQEQQELEQQHEQQRWGFEDGHACRYAGDGDAAAVEASEASDAEAAKAPRCEHTAECEAVSDDEGRMWGFEHGRSCLVVVAVQGGAPPMGAPPVPSPSPAAAGASSAAVAAAAAAAAAGIVAPAATSSR